jgi:hypothetical protein
MNAETAAGILGGAVNQTAACQFETRASPPYTLRIEVGKSHKCRHAATPLKGIGNEAIACSEEGANGERIQLVIGRVRDQTFEIRIATKDHSATAASLLEKARLAADQVSGNLF